MKIKKYLWILPFCFFAGGYYFLSTFISSPKVAVPNLLGKSASEALVIASNNNLCIKIIGEKNDEELPEGTILHQTPINQQVKRNQAIFVLISKKPPQKTAPNLLEQSESKLDEILLKKGVKAKKFYLQNSPGYCFCQYPEANQVVGKEKLIVYIGQTDNKPYLFPNLKGESLSEIIEFLKFYNLKIKVFRRGKEEESPSLSSIVLKQKPLPGSIINLKNLSTVMVEIG